MKSPLVLLATLCLVASGIAQAPKQGTLAVDTQIPLVMDGKLVGDMTLKAGTQVNIIQVLPDGVLVSRGAEPPFKIPKESLPIETPSAPATPTAVVATPTPVATPPPSIVAATPKPIETDEPITPAPLTGQGYVSIEKTSSGGFQLLRDGKPYYINGICCAWGSTQEKAVSIGANSTRTYNDETPNPVKNTKDTEQILKESERTGMTVLIGIGLTTKPELYTDSTWKAGIMRQVTGIVGIAKNSPATLMYCVGNEVNLQCNTPEMWKFINEVAVYIHQLDPHHPVIGDISVSHNADVATKNLMAYAPALDAIGINCYRPISQVNKALDDANYKGPWLITEFGPLPKKNKMGTFIENNSDELAKLYAWLYRRSKENKPCLGSYAFIWHTSNKEQDGKFGTSLESFHIPNLPKLGLHGEARTTCDIMQTAWTTTVPATPSPHIESITINGSKDVENCTFKKGEEIAINFKTVDPKNNSLTYVWHLYQVDPKEHSDLREGFSRTEIQAITKNDHNGAISLSIPNAGFYRIYGYSLNNKGKAATMNIPIQIVE